MNIIIYLAILAATLLMLWVLVRSLIGMAQTFGREQVEARISALDISSEHKAAALDYFDRVEVRALSVDKRLWDRVRAPFILFFALRKLPWEAAALPPALEYWDNNISINGDGWGWQREDGSWCNDCKAEPPPPGVTPVPYTSMDYGGDAYYAPGHHPRSWYARWIWLAFRNVASKHLQAMGPLIETRPILLAGEPRKSAYAPGFVLYWNGKDGDEAVYQWHAIDKFGPLVEWTNVGAKLGDAYQWPETMPCRAMLTCTWRAFKWGSA